MAEWSYVELPDTERDGAVERDEEGEEPFVAANAKAALAAHCT